MARWTRVVCAAFAVPLATTAFAQDSVEQFYRGKSINIIIGSGPGGGYDAYARALSRHMGKYIPGNPTIVPQNLPGAGGNKAAGYVYSVAPKDGTAIGAIFPASIRCSLATRAFASGVSAGIEAIMRLQANGEMQFDRTLKRRMSSAIDFESAAMPSLAAA